MNREEHLMKTFPLEDGTTYIQNLDKSFRYCQSQIEDNGKCETQCEHCKEYYAPLENEPKEGAGVGGESLKENFIDNASSELKENSADTMYNWIRKHSGK
jgi:hypothetical protein